MLFSPSLSVLVDELLLQKSAFQFLCLTIHKLFLRLYLPISVSFFFSTLLLIDPFRFLLFHNISWCIYTVRHLHSTTYLNPSSRINNFFQTKSLEIKIKNNNKFYTNFGLYYHQYWNFSIFLMHFKNYTLFFFLNFQNKHHSIV